MVNSQDEQTQSAHQLSENFKTELLRKIATPYL